MVKRGTMLMALMAAFSALSAQAPATGIAQVSVRILRPSVFARTGGYDPATEVRLAGTVVAVEGSLVRLRLDCGLVQVDLGLAGQDLAVAPGQRMACVASKVMREGRQTLLAREVELQGNRVALRDAAGLPLVGGTTMQG